MVNPTEAAFYSLLYNIINETLNSISIASALLVICAITYLRTKHKNISNRVSLRLQTYVSISDLLFSTFQIMSVNSNPPGNWICSVAPWGFVFTALLGCFLNVAIAFNLQLIFVHKYINTHRFEKFYIIIPLTLSLVLSILPISFGALGYDDKEATCWYRDGTTIDAIIWQLTTLHGWIVLTVLYCTFSVIVVIVRLNHSTKKFINMSRYAPNSSVLQDRSYKRQLVMNQAVKRIVLYPIVPIITFVFNIISNIVFFYTKSNPVLLQMLANVGTSSQGLLNSLVFCLDPAMKKFWNIIFDKLKINNDTEMNNDSNICVSDKSEDDESQSKYYLL